MIEREVTIINRLGLHARAAAKFVTLASQYESHIQVGREGRLVNGKSIMGVLMLAAAQDCTIVIQVDGADEVAAMDALVALIDSRFDEGE